MLSRPKITIVGGGNVGASCALWAASKELGDIVVVDIPQAEGMVKGKMLDLAQCAPIERFDAKITALSALVLHLSRSRRFNTGRAPVAKVLPELVALCRRADELRRAVLESTWEGLPYMDSHGQRSRVTASGIEAEEMDADYVQDIADFIAGVGCELREFFFEPSD